MTDIYYQTDKGKLINADVIQGLRSLPDESVHCCVTSPPYFGLRSYQTNPVVWGGESDCLHEWDVKKTTLLHENRNFKSGKNDEVNGNVVHIFKNSDMTHAFCQKCGAWQGELGAEPSPELFVEHLVSIFREVRRVLRKDGICFLNLGDSYWGGKGQSGSRGPEYQDERSDNGESLNKGYQTLGGAKLTKPTDGKHDTLKPKDLCMIPFRVASALQADGWFLRSIIPWVKRAAMPESVKDRPHTAHEYIFMLTKSGKYFYDFEAVRKQVAQSTLNDKRNGTGRHTQGKKESKYYDKSSPDTTKADMPSWYRAKTFVNPQSGRHRRTTDWFFDSLQAILDGENQLLHSEDGEPLAAVINPQGFSDAHFATFPPRLIEPMIKAAISEKGCCKRCGSPWKRVVSSKPGIDEDGYCSCGRKGGHPATKIDTARQRHEIRENSFCCITKTIGWQPTCNCLSEGYDEPLIPCTVLDPFGGAGTTAVVSESLGQNWVLIELNPEYCEMAKNRIIRESEKNKAKIETLFSNLPN